MFVDALTGGALLALEGLPLPAPFLDSATSSLSRALLTQIRVQSPHPHHLLRPPDPHTQACSPPCSVRTPLCPSSAQMIPTSLSPASWPTLRLPRVALCAPASWGQGVTVRLRKAHCLLSCWPHYTCTVTQLHIGTESNCLVHVRAARKTSLP